ncbi:MAG: hypothetical protein ABL864_09430 [Terricaulis sp.]
MAVDAVILKRLLEAELAKLSDARVDSYVRGLLVEPTPTPRDWDYGRPGQQYVCWTVLEHPPSNNSIAYCIDGFGPRSPWGLLFLTGEYTSMGMDSQWYPTFLQTFFESKAASYLPIWRVFKTDASGAREAISDESTWDETWGAVMAYRKADPAVRYDCDTSIPHERE